MNPNPSCSKNRKLKEKEKKSKIKMKSENQIKSIVNNLDTTLHNLQRFLTFLTSLLSIMNSPIFSVQSKLKFSLLIVLMTSKST